MEPGDSILCEEYTYPHVPESLVSPVGYRSIGVRIDEDGVVPELLRETLEGLQSQGEKLPKLLYTVPVGQNPTGQAATLQCLQPVLKRPSPKKICIYTYNKQALEPAVRESCCSLPGTEAAFSFLAPDE